ncbi:uncharacterized protein LOC106052125 isoform X1 [Biomphalaria glabrata]|uniref:Uncharacterized protein LOC106052125 isoform X1 n=1 Tax=Biomphalaria glabrata TaxID=6526 RepID=A0A9W2ZKN2_BIOGL|nr:uncharacterized protein LOC106052125 isoform X1 [Biomphalaria glabrata]
MKITRMRVIQLRSSRHSYVIIFVVSLVTIIFVFRSKLHEDTHSDILLKERNDLSHRLNDILRLYGQQHCELLKMKMVDSRVSQRGGWCWSMSSPDSQEHKWDKGFANALSSFLKGKTVGSFGDGPGAYKSYLDSLGEVRNYTAYDGAPYIEDVTKGLVKFLDLTSPQYDVPIFDWVLSIEVGEHIPPQYEDTYLDNLARHAREGLILSWASPGQNGLSHVNTKPLADVVLQMNRRGFTLNVKAGELLRNASTFYWLRNNVNVYHRASITSLDELRA